MGWAAPGNFVPEFEAAMNELQPGQVSPPVATEFGVHLIEVLQRRMVEMTRDQIKQQIENQLREQKAGKATEDWLLNLRGRAFIEMREPPQ
ncbi:MAG: peptidylprolyl isomerase [Betaproteobacteria bacterium]|nr:peptidylprolyl isomerase [Betaproteobacteria bacterium]